MQDNQLTHFDQHGQAHMVDIGDKPMTKRVAVAQGTIFVSAQAFDCVVQGNNKKGDVLGVARLAAIQASKHTALLIPLSHPLALTHVSVEFTLDDTTNSIQVTART